MQVFGLCRSFARAAKIAPRPSSERSREIAESRRDALDRWHAARHKGLDAADAAAAVGVPRSTLFRWDRRRKDGRLEPDKSGPRTPRKADRPSDPVRAVRDMRKEYPMQGKAKIAVALRREGRDVSESKVGRILRDLMKRGEVEPVPALRRKGRRSARSKRAWAERRPSGLRPETPGEIVQIDTMVAAPKYGWPGIKQFNAADPVSKWACGHAFRSATARNARTFLRKTLQAMPFEVKAIQIDGGSESRPNSRPSAKPRASSFRSSPEEAGTQRMRQTNQRNLAVRVP